MEDPDGKLSCEMRVVHKRYRSLKETVRQKGSATESQVEDVEQVLRDRGDILRRAAENRDRLSQKKVQETRKVTNDALDELERRAEEQACAAEEHARAAQDQKQHIKRLRAPLAEERSSADQRVDSVFSSLGMSSSSSSTSTFVHDLVD